MGYLTHRVDPNVLKAGDHIYTWRTAYTYAHHEWIQGGRQWSGDLLFEMFHWNWKLVPVSVWSVKLEYFSKVRGGTCTIAPSDPPQEVIHRALYLLQNNIFGKYHVARNNCEDFALYCKAGLLIGGSPTTGSSGQVNTVSNAPWKSIITYGITKVASGTSALGAITAVGNTGLYLYNRYNSDIGVRDDAVKVEVEDMPLFRAVPCEAVNCVNDISSS